MKTFSEVDEGNGVVMTYWDSIRERVAKVEPKFAEIVDRIGPGREFPVFLVYFPYGVLKGDTQHNFLPNMDGSFYRIGDPDEPKIITKHLSYGLNTAPLALVLDKHLELFIDLKIDNITLPRRVLGPGSLFPFAHVLTEKSKKSFVPNGVLNAFSGSRSIFMLPQIGRTINHARLKSDYNIRSSTPRGLYDHCRVFSEIVNSEVVNSKWRSCLMYFSEEWITKIRNDTAWVELRAYILEKGHGYFNYDMASGVYHNFVFSTIQRERNLKPNPYIVDTARHILTTALGEAPGYIPICDEESLPLHDIQKAFVESYGMKKYYPTILGPAAFAYEPGCKPVYYSLQYPATNAFSPKSRNMSSVLFEMNELIHVLNVFIEELCKETSMCYNTDLEKINKRIDLSFYHYKSSNKGGIRNTEDLYLDDPRFLGQAQSNLKDLSRFSSDGKFMRGCVKIAHK